MKWMKEILVLLCNFVQIYWFDMIVWIILIALIILCVRLVRAIFSRFLFIARLKKITKKNAIELKICRFPLLSLFLFSAGIDIEINTTNQFFNVSFCPGYVLRKNVYIFSENKIYYSNIRAKSF